MIWATVNEIWAKLYCAQNFFSYHNYGFMQVFRNYFNIEQVVFTPSLSLNSLDEEHTEVDKEILGIIEAMTSCYFWKSQLFGKKEKKERNNLVQNRSMTLTLMMRGKHSGLRSIKNVTTFKLSTHRI